MPHCPCDHSSSSSPGRPWSCHVSVALTIPRLPAGRAKSSVSPSSQTTTAGCPWTLQAPRRRVKCCVSRPHCRAHMFDMLHAVRRLNGRGKVATEQEEHQHRSLATNNTPPWEDQVESPCRLSACVRGRIHGSNRPARNDLRNTEGAKSTEAQG